MKTAIEMAREAGIEFQYITGVLGGVIVSTMGSQRLYRIERLVELVRADERARMAEQPAQQEPVAYKCWHPSGYGFYYGTEPASQFRADTGESNEYFGGKTEPLYTSQPAQRTWVGLTEDEREQHRNDWHSNIHDKEFQAIEAKLREKNQCIKEQP